MDYVTRLVLEGTTVLFSKNENDHIVCTLEGVNGEHIEETAPTTDQAVVAAFNALARERGHQT